METGIGVAAPPARECPECGAAVPRDERYVEWCEACDWNVDPGAPDPESGRIASVRRRLAQQVVCDGSRQDEVSAELAPARAALARQVIRDFAG
ncbi:hypothetical protein OG429_05855 [Streptomyces sp. NBC_00190]|uniref:hypothetical protein n=1 Tax=unclassified Streptomyces TaxID=2593676 RepID=UPI002E2BC767|nr:hypothetical protein [Streptomyces sp. NBC_00190]WSZ38893.1 hypothetical protein OG239_08865 [Streptomyces sp. NBC_00868]